MLKCNHNINAKTPTNNQQVQIQTINGQQCLPKYPVSTDLNICASQQFLNNLQALIDQSFQNKSHLSYYINITTDLQINDKQINLFTAASKENLAIPIQFTIINLDLDLKSQNKNIKIHLYAIAIKNNTFTPKEPNKSKWKFIECLNAQQIYHKYGITKNHLPKSSRKMPQFLQQLKQKSIITQQLIHNTDWINITQIKAKKKSKSKIPKITMTLSQRTWIKECEKAMTCTSEPLIPIIIKQQHQHWIEFVKIVHIESQNISIGVTFKQQTNGCMITSIMLDRNDILKKYKLTGINSKKHIQQLTNSSTTISKILWKEKPNPLQQQILTLKRQVQTQQQLITKFRQHKTNTTKHNIDQNTDDQMLPLTQLNKAINTFISENTTTVEPISSDSEFLWINSIIDAVTKDYEMTIFQTETIGAKRNINIEQQFIQDWITKVTKTFEDEIMMYYWLDYTISMQMIQKYAKTYINKNNHEFIAVIANTELHNTQKQALYAIISLNEQTNSKDKYPYKLTSLMTKHEIKDKFYICESDLPKCSRKHPEFIKQISSPRPLNETDIIQLNWANVKKHPTTRSKRANNKTQTTISINPVVMKNCIKAAIKKMNPPQQPRYALLPILTIDKNQEQYQIHWVLPTEIKKNSHIAISFRYNTHTDTFTAKEIFLTKYDVEVKHKLIGLKFNLAKYLPDFAKFKFKTTTQNQHYKRQIIQHGKQIQQLQQQNQLLAQQFIMYQTQRHK